MSRHTFVVRTPQSSSLSKEGGVALGVSTNSNSLSLPLRLVDLDMVPGDGWAFVANGPQTSSTTVRADKVAAHEVLVEVEGEERG